MRARTNGRTREENKTREEKLTKVVMRNLIQTDNLNPNNNRYRYMSVTARVSNVKLASMNR
jgi:hypothetical protein